MIDDVYKETTKRMEKSIAALEKEFSKIRTGRAHPSLLNHVMVDYYGSDVPLSQVANLSVEDARTLSITPWENPMVPVIEKAIMKSDLGLNPSTAGTVIRIVMPPLTEERRRGLVKIVRAEAENGRVSVRNARRDANNDLKEFVKEKMISEDEQRRGEGEIQKLTDQFIADIDKLVEAKEQEVMSV